MALIRLFEKGGNELEGVIDDISLHTVPNVGDVIVMDYGRSEKKVQYRVLARFFHVEAMQDISSKKEQIALEVEPIQDLHNVARKRYT